MKPIDGEGVDGVPLPVEVAGHGGRRPDGQAETEAMLILLLARRHAQLHDCFVDQIRIRQLCLMFDLK
jgi:hypothetical protein